MNADVGVITVSGANQTTPTNNGMFSASSSESGPNYVCDHHQQTWRPDGEHRLHGRQTGCLRSRTKRSSGELIQAWRVATLDLGLAPRPTPGPMSTPIKLLRCPVRTSALPARRILT